MKQLETEEPSEKVRQCALNTLSVHAATKAFVFTAAQECLQFQLIVRSWSWIPLRKLVVKGWRMEFDEIIFCIVEAINFCSSTGQNGQPKGGCFMWRILDFVVFSRESQYVPATRQFLPAAQHSKQRIWKSQLPMAQSIPSPSPYVQCTTTAMDAAIRNSRVDEIQSCIIDQSIVGSARVMRWPPSDSADLVTTILQKVTLTGLDADQAVCMAILTGFVHVIDLLWDFGLTVWSDMALGFTVAEVCARRTLEHGDATPEAQSWCIELQVSAQV
ncbi:Aste57867_5384 [Aphanomyces stellatus]|uniref:Aste57867_5384 protein n=1 Tax=Aphanomyces stellatus TaxID=120398 RepID=A0A485KEJ1_9STRA|nr:hypothetical protein As57867_005371 [Aphanomyces stellatus]VFT82442.1 Aste57867_5384 [Aphanomyces stellatus]